MFPKDISRINVPIIVDDEGELVVQVYIDYHPTLLKLDTGNPETIILSNDIANEMGFESDTIYWTNVFGLEKN